MVRTLSLLPRRKQSVTLSAPTHTNALILSGMFSGHKSGARRLATYGRMTANLSFLAAGLAPSPLSHSSSPRREPFGLSLYSRPAMASFSLNPPSQRSLGGGPFGEDQAPLSTLNADFLRAMNEKKTTRGFFPNPVRFTTRLSS